MRYDVFASTCVTNYGAVFLSQAFGRLEVGLTTSRLGTLLRISQDCEYTAAVQKLSFGMEEAWLDDDDWNRNAGSGTI